MKIGIISDTHSKVKKAKNALKLLLDNGAEFIIHAGDIVELEMLEMLKNCGKRYVAVYGNNDAHLVQYHDDYNLVKEPYYFKLADTTFKLMHLPYYMSGDVEVVVFGHTHHFLAELKGDTLFLNSGEVCARKKPLSECAMLEISDDKFLITDYAKDNHSDKFVSKEFSYQRAKQ
jgi:putative phosphoesterase